MRLLLCPDKFKGSANADEVVHAIEAGITKSAPQVEFQHLPIADGGEGFALTASKSRDGIWVECETLDALHRPINASYFVSGETAYMDMASCCGLDKIPASERDPMLSSTRGTGLLMRHAIENHQISDLVIGLGGSATNDGGAGMAQELGVRFLDSQGAELTPVPAELIHCTEIDCSGLIALPKITAACDVSNPLLGPEGASYIYGPQKGVISLEDADAILANLMVVGNGQESGQTQGAGAAGGLAYGLLHYAGAILESGFELVAEITQLEEAIAAADIVITGEGSLDKQTLNGKGPHGVATLAQKHSKPCFAIAGKVEPCAAEHFTASYALANLGFPIETCIAEAPRLIEKVAQQLADEQL